MLTADQIAALRDAAGGITDPMNAFLVKDIARRVAQAGQLTSTASYQIWRAQQMGLSQREIKKQLRKLLKASHRELRKLLTQAAEVGYNFDIDQLPYVQALPFAQNASVQQMVAAAVKLAQEDLTNLTQTLGLVAPDGVAYPLQAAYQKSMDYTFQQVFTGSADYNTAIRGATRHLANMGVRVIDYESGAHTSLEAATRRNVMGGLGLMVEQITQQNHDTLGADGWEISAHAASAPDHEPIQGKQYDDAAYAALNGSLQRRIGTLNCGHAAFPIIMGVNSPQYTAQELRSFRTDNEAGITYQGRHYTIYQATQQQRRVERAMRREKTRILAAEGAGDTDKLTANQIRLQRLRDEYSRFSKAAGLPTQQERAQVAGFGRGQAARATAAAKRVIEFDRKHLAQSETELLPTHKKAKIPDDKLSGYALNKSHPTGRHKAIAFEKALGYNLDNQQLLIEQVRRGLGRYRATERSATQYGRPFEVQMMLRGTNGKYAKVKTGWQIDDDTDFPKLVTIYVDE